MEARYPVVGIQVGTGVRGQESPPGWEGSDLVFPWWRGVALDSPLRTPGTTNMLVGEPAQGSAYAGCLLNGAAQVEGPQKLLSRDAASGLETRPAALPCCLRPTS